MAQHDYNIANASFPTVRTDINNVLSAINSSNSGSSRPSSAVAGTIWLDTSGAATAQLLKLYDGAADITLATVNFTANTVDFTDSSVTIADDSVTLAKMASGTDGNIISYDASGNPVAVATGSDGQVLTSTGAGSPPAFENTILFKTEGTNFTNSLLVGHATTGTLDAAEKNTGVGIAALDAITSADLNTAVGYQAGSALTTGTKNTFIGADNGKAVSTKYQNTAVGYNCLASGSFDGHSNTVLGVNAGEAVTTGNKNVFLGWSSGNNVTSGSGNVVIGNADVSSATGSDQLSISDGEDGSVVWITGSSAGVVTFNAANVTQQALTSSSNAVAWDASAKPNAVHITTENTTFSAPSNAVEGAFICLEINYNGSHTIAFNTVFEFAASTAPTTTDTDGKTDILVFRYNGAVWQEVGRTLNLSES